MHVLIETRVDPQLNVINLYANTCTYFNQFYLLGIKLLQVLHEIVCVLVYNKTKFLLFFFVNNYEDQNTKRISYCN